VFTYYSALATNWLHGFWIYSETHIVVVVPVVLYSVGFLQNTLTLCIIGSTWGLCREINQSANKVGHTEGKNVHEAIFRRKCSPSQVERTHMVCSAFMSRCELEARLLKLAAYMCVCQYFILYVYDLTRTNCKWGLWGTKTSIIHIILNCPNTLIFTWEYLLLCA